MTITPRFRPVLLAGVAASVLTLSACGGIADKAPTDADPTEFCNAYFDEELSAADVAQKLADIGTPDDITDAERNGFEIYVDGLDDEGDTLNKDVTSVQIPADDQADGNAFVTYARDTCSAVAPTDGTTPAPSEPSAS